MYQEISCRIQGLCYNVIFKYMWYCGESSVQSVVKLTVLTTALCIQHTHTDDSPHYRINLAITKYHKDCNLQLIS